MVKRQKKQRAAWLILVFVILAAGIGWLFQLKFGREDLHPEMTELALGDFDHAIPDRQSPTFSKDVIASANPLVSDPNVDRTRKNPGSKRRRTRERPRQDPHPNPLPTAIDPAPVHWTLLDMFGETQEDIPLLLSYRVGGDLRTLEIESDGNGSITLPEEFSDANVTFVDCTPESPEHIVEVLGQAGRRPFLSNAVVRWIPKGRVEVELATSMGGLSAEPFVLSLLQTEHRPEDSGANDGLSAPSIAASAMSEDGTARLHCGPGNYHVAIQLPGSTLLRILEPTGHSLKVRVRAGSKRSIQVIQPDLVSRTVDVVSASGIPGATSPTSHLTFSPYALDDWDPSFGWKSDTESRVSVRTLNNLQTPPVAQPLEEIQTHMIVKRRRSTGERVYWGTSKAVLMRDAEFVCDFKMGPLAGSDVDTQITSLLDGRLWVPGFDLAWKNPRSKNRSVVMSAPDLLMVDCIYESGSWLESRSVIAMRANNATVDITKDVKLATYTPGIGDATRTKLARAPALRWTCRDRRNNAYVLSATMRFMQKDSLFLPHPKRLQLRSKGVLDWHNTGTPGILGIGGLSIRPKRVQKADPFLIREYRIRCIDEAGRLVPFAPVHGHTGQHEPERGNADAMGYLRVFVQGTATAYLDSAWIPYPSQVRLQHKKNAGTLNLVVPTIESTIRLRVLENSRPQNLIATVSIADQEPDKNGWVRPPLFRAPVNHDGTIEFIGLIPGSYEFEVRQKEGDRSPSTGRVQLLRNQTYQELAIRKR